MKVTITEKHVLLARNQPFMACFPDGITELQKFRHIAALQERAVVSEAMGGNHEYVVAEKDQSRVLCWMQKFRYREVLELPFFFEVNELIEHPR